jgi:hypothetical protein
MRATVYVLLGVICWASALAGESATAGPPLLRELRAKLPAGWSYTVYQGNEVKQVPHGMGKPVFEFIASNTNASFAKDPVAGPAVQNPVVPLYFYPQALKPEIMKHIEKEKVYSWAIPIYFGETEDFVVVTSPAFVNGGVFTPEARRALRPAWKVLRELIPKKEVSAVDELAAEE